jgi:AcrR family transcriptional regulator
MDTVETLDRRGMIVEAAIKVFLSYGFKRTTMADIADAAGISRPALYIEFKNKADIYRAGFIDMIEKTFRNVDAAIVGDAPLPARLMAALNAGIVVPMRDIASTPHGAELFELKQEIADDLGHDWNTVLQRTLEHAITHATASGEIALPERMVPNDLARLIVSSVEGIKKRTSDWDRIETDFAGMIDLMVRPLISKKS